MIGDSCWKLGILGDLIVVLHVQGFTYLDAYALSKHRYEMRLTAFNHQAPSFSFLFFSFKTFFFTFLVSPLEHVI